MITKIISVKLMGAAIAAAALSGAAVVAYNGQLPSHIQSTVSDGLSKVGVSIPNPAKASLSSATADASSRNALSGGVDQGLISGHSLYGLCVAYSHVFSNAHSSTSTTTTAASSTTTISTTTAASATGSVATGSDSVEFQRLKAFASSKGESIAQLCAGTNPKANDHAVSSVPAGNQHAGANSHAPLAQQQTTGSPGGSSANASNHPANASTSQHGRGGSASTHGQPTARGPA